MFCKKCGSIIEDYAQFCKHCGQDQSKPCVDEACAEVVENTEPEEDLAEKRILADQIFKFGLIGAILSDLVLPAIVGIIFSCKAKKAVRLFREKFGALRGKALAGHILSIVGLVLGIVMTVVLALYLIIIAIYVFSIIAMVVVQNAE